MITSVRDHGAARERTTLAWTRTALGLLGNGVLVLVRHEDAFPLGVSLALGTASVLVAVLALVHAGLRRRVIDQPDPDITAPTAAVTSLGLAVGLLCVLTLIALLIWP